MGVTKGLVQEFGRDRILDTPITEAGFIGAAVGAAATGLRPVAELMFVDFFGCCMDQIFDQGAKLRYMFGGKAQVPAGDPDDDRGRGQCRRAALRLPLLGLHPHAGHQMRGAIDPGRREGTAAQRDPRRRSGDVLREQGALRA